MPLPPTLSRLAAAGLVALAVAVPLSTPRAADLYDCPVVGAPPSVDQVLGAAAVEFKGVPGADPAVILARLDALSVGALSAPIGGRLWATMRAYLVDREGIGPHLPDEVAAPLLCRIWRAAPGVSL